MRTEMRWASLIVVIGACAKPIPRPYAEPASLELIAHIRENLSAMHSLRAETKSDVRLGKERANLKVLIMAETSGSLRIMAINPNDSMAADLATDGATYCFVDANHDCGECGPASEETVARLLGIAMAPGDLVALLFGGTPILANSSARVDWDASNGHEVLYLATKTHLMRIVLSGAKNRWDVLESELSTDGRLVWRVRNKGFRELEAADGAIVRLPEKSLFEQPQDSVLVKWKEQEVNVPLDAKRAFELTVDERLRPCKTSSQ